MAGIRASYVSRWRHGQMYVDRAENLVRLAGALGVEIKILIDLACGTITAERALRIHSGDRGPAETFAPAAFGDPELVGEFRPGPSPTPSRHLVLLISASAEHRGPLLAALQRHEHVSAFVADNLLFGLVVAERYRPHITFVDLDVCTSLAGEACRALSGLASGPRQRNRVVAGTATVTDGTTTSALMAGARAVYSVPFQEAAFLAEFGRLPSLAGSRRKSKTKATAPVDETGPATTGHAFAD